MNLIGWRAVLALLTLGLVALIVWAGFNANFLTSFAYVLNDPWGVVAIADLYIGFILVAGIILAFDGIKPSSFFWIIALFCGGNVVTAVWLGLRLPKLIATSKGQGGWMIHNKSSGTPVPEGRPV